jgi:ethanolaminephosphotransferase
MYRGYLTPDGLQQIKNHKYVSGVYSHLDNILNPTWNSLAEKLPKWLAPNMITFIGFIILFSQCVIYALCDSTLSTSQPPICYFFSAFAVLFYQTLDSLDGKQARRIGLSTPLGQLFDHGCDCVGMGFILYSLYSALMIGEDPKACYFIFLISTATFYSSNWAEYHTHVLVTSNGCFGVTEILFMISGINIISGIFGPIIWHFHIFGIIIRDEVVLDLYNYFFFCYNGECIDNNARGIPKGRIPKRILPNDHPILYVSDWRQNLVLLFHDE